MELEVKTNDSDIESVISDYDDKFSSEYARLMALNLEDEPLTFNDIIDHIFHQSASSEYIHSSKSLIPKGRSILARGGGLSNNPVQYTNSRSFKNIYKGTGTLSSISNNQFNGLESGLGMRKGHSILNTGGGLSGMSLFKMKHYNPLETINDDVGGVEEEEKKYSESRMETEAEYKERHRGTSQLLNKGAKKGTINIDSVPASTRKEILQAKNAKRDLDDDESSIDSDPTDLSTDLGTLFRLSPKGRQKQAEENLKHLQLQARADQANAKGTKNKPVPNPVPNPVTPPVATSTWASRVTNPVATTTATEPVATSTTPIPTTTATEPVITQSGITDLISLLKLVTVNTKSMFGDVKWDQSFEADGSDKSYMIYKNNGGSAWEVIKGTEGSTLHNLNKVLTSTDVKIDESTLKTHGSYEGSSRFLVVAWNSNIGLDITTFKNSFTEALKQNKAKQKKADPEPKPKAKPKPKADPVADPNDAGAHVEKISLIDRIIEKSSSLDQTFQATSGNKTWVIVMSNGNVKSGNVGRMKTALNHVGVGSDMTAGLKEVKKFKKHEHGQAYHISKEMLTKALGITETKLNAMANKEKWDEDIALRLMMLDFPDVPNKRPNKIIVQK